MYDYLEDIRQWNEKHPKDIYVGEPIEVSRWLR
jgi:hypothetical protein